MHTLLGVYILLVLFLVKSGLINNTFTKNTDAANFRKLGQILLYNFVCRCGYKTLARGIFPHTLYSVARSELVHVVLCSAAPHAVRHAQESNERRFFHRHSQCDWPHVVVGVLVRRICRLYHKHHRWRTKNKFLAYFGIHARKCAVACGKKHSQALVVHHIDYVSAIHGRPVQIQRGSSGNYLVFI